MSYRRGPQLHCCGWDSCWFCGDSCCWRLFPRHFRSPKYLLPKRDSITRLLKHRVHHFLSSVIGKTKQYCTYMKQKQHIFVFKCTWSLFYNLTLKGQSHEIFDTCIFNQTVPLEPTNTVRFFLWICGNIEIKKFEKCCLLCGINYGIISFSQVTP